MSTFVDTRDRLDHLKDAFAEIISTVNNVNVGLMRFTDPGGPILWPVSAVDADVNAIEAPGEAVGFPVNVQVSDGADDAEELLATGTVDLASPVLEIAEVNTGITQTLSVVNDAGMRVIDQNNNAEEDGAGNILTGDQFDMDPSQFNAVRFNSVPIPADSPIGDVTIDNARVKFTARNGDDDAPTFEISGHKTVTPPAFPASCTGCSDVSARGKTDARVIWSPEPWSIDENGPDTTTEDLSTIVQELIRLPGWQGSGNAIVFRLDPSTSSGKRRAYTFRGSQGIASRRPELQVTYTLNTVTSAIQDQMIGMRFRQVSIPTGATITSAVLEFFPFEVLADAIDITIVGERIGDSPAFTTATKDLSNRTPTVANV